MITLVIARDTEEIGVVVCYLNVNNTHFIWSFKHCEFIFVSEFAADHGVYDPRTTEPNLSLIHISEPTRPY